MSRGSAGTEAEFGSSFFAVKPASYYSGARVDIVDRLPRDPSASILEVGCGTGATGALALSERCCARYIGIEADPLAAEEAGDLLTEVICGDVETIEPHWQPAAFDAIILSESLDGLSAPAASLTKLARFVRPGGMLLASSHNIAHWTVIRDLLLGRFSLFENAAPDRARLRRFTPETFAGIIEAAGFAVAEIGSVTPFGSKAEILSNLTGGRFDHLFMTRIAVVAYRR